MQEFTNTVRDVHAAAEQLLSLLLFAIFGYHIIVSYWKHSK
jgi:hypothetical protein